MSSRQVVIPSRGRAPEAKKLTAIWQSKGFNVTWMVEPEEHDIYCNALASKSGPLLKPGSHTFVTALDKSNAGISYSRNCCVELAEQQGWPSIILADDDIKPSTRRCDGMADILEACEHPKITGITARYSYHDLCLGPDIKDMDDIILLPTGTFRLVGLNVKNVLELGNYDTDLEYAEDCDLFLRSLQAGRPWLVHLGSFANSIGTRYTPGGMLDYAGGDVGNLSKSKELWHQQLHDKWPTVTNEHKPLKCRGKQNCIRVYWQKAYDQFLPNWRQWSELHGGDLQDYIDA